MTSRKTSGKALFASLHMAPLRPSFITSLICLVDCVDVRVHVGGILGLVTSVHLVIWKGALSSQWPERREIGNFLWALAHAKRPLSNSEELGRQSLFYAPWCLHLASSEECMSAFTTDLEVDDTTSDQGGGCGYTRDQRCYRFLVCQVGSYQCRVELPT